MSAINRARYQISLLKAHVERLTTLLDSPVISLNLQMNIEYELKACESLLADKYAELERMYDAAFDEVLDAQSGSQL